MATEETDLMQRLGMEWPIIQAPMAGVSTPTLAAAVSNAGGMGSLGVGASSAEAARSAIRETQALTNRAFNINLFCHVPAQADARVEAEWLARMAPLFGEFGASPPAGLAEIYRSFVEDDDMFAVLLEERPRVVSFHFGLPSQDKIDALRAAGIVLLASATNLADAKRVQAAGIDAVVAQGIEAGGHRGVFDPSAPDSALGCLALTQVLAQKLDIPVIAAGGLMSGGAVAAALAAGAQAAQLGTAFIACPESQADPAYRDALQSEAAHSTVLTAAFSGRPARGLPNRLTAWAAENADATIPSYPIAYDATKALNAVAKPAGSGDFGAHWAGQAAALSRPMPVADLMQALIAEFVAATG